MLPPSTTRRKTRGASGPVDLVALADAITVRLEADGARRHGGELTFRCPAPDHEDRNPSANWKPVDGVWCCYSKGCHQTHGGGALALAALLGIDADRYREPAAPIPFVAAAERRNGTGPTKGKGQGQDAPAPAGAAPAATYASLADFEARRGLPPDYLATTWKVTEGMHDKRRALFWPSAPGLRKRVKYIDGGKGYNWTGKGTMGAHLYGLPLALERLAANPSAPLYVANGEPAVWAAAAAKVAAMCFGVGESSTPPPALAAELRAALQGIGHSGPVHVVYDADGAGRAGGPKVAAALAAAGMDAAALDLGAWNGWETHAMPPGADVGDMFQAAGADALADALASLPTMKASQAAEPATTGSAEKAPPESQAAALARIGKTAELFTDENGRAFATITSGDRRETHAVRATAFRRWLGFAYFKETGGRVPAASAYVDALTILEGHAAYKDDAKVQSVHVRYAEHDGRIYIDLGRPDWRAVEVSAAGWQVISEPPVRFRRAKAMAPMPEPERGGSVDLLLPFVNLGADDWPLFLGWLVCAMRPRGPYPVLVLGGEQGSSKSTIMKVARRLVDPNTAPLRAEPKEARDLAIAANNAHCLALDNLDRVEAWLSNALCRLSTGGGFAVRALYADDEETIFQATRPVALNGIGDVATRPDLLERSLMLAPPTISKDKRKTEDAFWLDFGQVEGRVFGAMLDALSTALRRLPSVHLGDLPRMADAALWVTAAEPGLGLAPRAFVAAITKNRDKAASLALEASPVAAALLSYLDEFGSHEGTTGDLLLKLTARVDRMDRPTGWPKSATQLSNALRRIMPALRDKGVTRAEESNTSAGKVYKTTKPKDTTPKNRGGTEAQEARRHTAEDGRSSASVPPVPVFPPYSPNGKHPAPVPLDGELLP